VGSGRAEQTVINTLVGFSRRDCGLSSYCAWKSVAATCSQPPQPLTPDHIVFVLSLLNNPPPICSLNMLPMAAMHALKIRELLDHILSMMDPDYDLVHCALVCRDWEVPALRCLWRDSPPADALFDLLGELRMYSPVVSASLVFRESRRSDISLNCV
jgi:hypothetical protein